MAALTIFDRLNRGRPAPTPTEPTREDPTTILLTWLIKHWGRPTVTLRDALRLGPRPLRNKETILHLTRSLEDKSWLTRRRNGHEWQIARGLPLN
jgi:hypothetical protein